MAELEMYSDPFRALREAGGLQRVARPMPMREVHITVTAEASHIFLERPREAPCCGQMRLWFVNRNGQTRCATCDDAELDRLRSAA